MKLPAPTLFTSLRDYDRRWSNAARIAVAPARRSSTGRSLMCRMPMTWDKASPAEVPPRISTAKWLNVVVGTDAANGRTGEPVSGIGDEATSDGRDMYARAEDTEVWVRLQYGGLAGGSDDVAPDIARGRLIEATRIVLDQATA
jgi:hypothetical protein